MKYFLLLTLTAFIASANDGANNHLTEWEKQNLLTSIDNICADTWCEGDYDWGFEELRCDFENAECFIDLTLKDVTYIGSQKEHDQYFSKKNKSIRRRLQERISVYFEVEGREALILYPNTCKITQIATKEDLFFKNPSDYTPRLYESVSECISSMEEKYWREIDQAAIDVSNQ